MKRLLIALLTITLLAALMLGCISEDWQTWQGDVLERQREGLPTSTPQAVSGFAWGG